MRAKTSAGRDHGRVFIHSRGGEADETGRGRKAITGERDAHPEPIPAGHFPGKGAVNTALPGDGGARGNAKPRHRHTAHAGGLEGDTPCEGDPRTHLTQTAAAPHPL